MRSIVTLIASLALAEQLTAGAFPPGTIVGGRTVGEWSAEWWKWVLPIAISENPMLDTNGSFAAVGQPEGDVFFLAGALGISPGTVTRHFSVPEGKYLFFPLIMYEADNVDTFPPLTVEELREQAAAVVNEVVELHASIDGVAIPNLFDHRAISPVFNLLYTDADNLHTFAFGHPVTGLIDPMVCDGYWLMIEPLPPGEHVVHFGGAFARFFFPVDIVDYITVVPESLSEKVGKLISSLEGSAIAGNRQRRLRAMLNAAADSFARNNVRAGINQLGTFQKQIRANIEREDSALAEQLAQAAQRIIERAEEQLTDRKN